MGGYNELDDILISVRQRRDKGNSAENGVELSDAEPKAKSRTQRAAEEAERLRIEQERLRKQQEEERRKQLERERIEKKRLEEERRKRLERERLEKQRLERERQRRIEKERILRQKQEAERKEKEKREKEEVERRIRQWKENQAKKQAELAAKEEEKQKKENETRRLKALTEQKEAEEAEILYQKNEEEKERIKAEKKRQRAVIRRQKNEKYSAFIERIRSKLHSEDETCDDLVDEDFVWYVNAPKTPKETASDILHKTKKLFTKQALKNAAGKIFVKPYRFMSEMFTQEIFPALKRKAKKILKKQLAAVLAIIVTICAFAYGGYRLYNYSKVAYLHEYSQKYPDVKFPNGILEELCEQYAHDESTAGKISDEAGNEFYITTEYDESCGYAHPNFDLKNEQQFQSVDVTGCCDLENMYSTTESFLESPQEITMTTLFSKSTYRVVCAFYTNTLAKDDSGYVFPYNCYGNMTEKSFRSYVDKISSRRLYETDYTFSYSDKILTLSEDTDFMNGFKFVVVCVKVDDGEKFEKSSTAIENESVHYPQVWYDENNQVNTYRFSAGWYPEIYINDKNDTKKLTASDFT